jgi:hypothetical protein
MIGVNILVSDILGSMRVFWLRRLIFGPLAPTLVGSAAFILEPDLDASL